MELLSPSLLWCFLSDPELEVSAVHRNSIFLHHHLPAVSTWLPWYCQGSSEASLLPGRALFLRVSSYPFQRARSFPHLHEGYNYPYLFPHFLRGSLEFALLLKPELIIPSKVSMSHVQAFAFPSEEQGILESLVEFPSSEIHLLAEVPSIKAYTLEATWSEEEVLHPCKEGA